MHHKEEYKCIVMALLLIISGVRTIVIIVQLYCLLTMRREKGWGRPDFVKYWIRGENHVDLIFANIVGVIGIYIINCFVFFYLEKKYC